MRRTRTSLGRAVRTAYRGAPGPRWLAPCIYHACCMYHACTMVRTVVPQATGVAPTDDGFTVIKPGAEDVDRDGASFVGDPAMGFAPLRRHGRTPAAAHLADHLADQHVGAVRWRLPPRCSDPPARPVPKHLHSAPALCTRPSTCPCTCTPLTAAHAPLRSFGPPFMSHFKLKVHPRPSPQP